MRILAIRLARFGDIVLLLPALSSLKACFPESHLTFLTDGRFAPLAAMCPAIDEVVSLDRIGMRDGSYLNAMREIVRFGRNLRRQKFDVAIDFHGFRETNLIAWWSRAPKRLGLKRADQSYLRFCFNQQPVLEDKNLHVADMFLKVAERFSPLPKKLQSRSPLVIPSETAHWVTSCLPPPPFSVLYVDAPVRDRIWPLERFIGLTRLMIRDLGVPVVVVGGPGRELKGFPDGVIVLSSLSIPRLAAVVASARLLVSNDTGPMHLGPALGIPTVGIFSVGIPTHFRPTGLYDRYVQGTPIQSVMIDTVYDAIRQVWEASERSNLQC